MKTIGTILAGAAIGTGLAFAVGPAEATAPAAPMRATTSCSTCVAPITCRYEDSCVLDYVGGSPGYWRARQATGTVWVRLTLVNGN